ncbi:MAG: hypothetical protein ACP5D9_09980, partial [Mariniphaga sp.]
AGNKVTLETAPGEAYPMNLFFPVNCRHSELMVCLWFVCVYAISQGNKKVPVTLSGIFSSLKITIKEGRQKRVTSGFKYFNGFNILDLSAFGSR